MSTDQMIDGCKKQQPKSQEQLYKHYYGYAMAICLRYSNGEGEAVEILNNAFLKVFEKINQIDEPKAFKSWLRKILINTSIDYYRKYNKESKVSYGLENIPEPTYDLESHGELSQEDILLEIQQLPPALKTVFNLYVFEGLKHKEIGEKINISESTSRANLANANRKLRENLKNRLKAATLSIMLMDTGEFHNFIRNSLSNLDPPYNASHWETLKQSIPKPSGISSHKEPNLAAGDIVTNSLGKITSFLNAKIYIIATIGVLSTVGWLVFTSNPFDQEPKKENALPLVNEASVITQKDTTNFLLTIRKHDSIRVSNNAQENHMVREEDTIALNDHEGSTDTPKLKVNKKIIPEKESNTRPGEVDKKQITKTQTNYQKEEARPVAGFDSLYQYFEDSIRYPDILTADSIIGQVKVSFIINKSGIAEKIEIKEGLHPLLDQEAKRVIKEMPPWFPATVNDNPISSRYTIPISFTFKNDE